MTRLQPDQNWFLDLSQIQPGSGMGLEEAVSGRVAPSFEDAGTGDFGGTRRDYVPRDPVAETVAARSQIATGGVGVQPDARVNYAPMQAINGYAADFIGSVEQTWNSLGSGLASGVSRAASTLSGGYLDLTGSQVPHDRRTAELLASDDPADRSAGMRLLEQERSVEEGGRAGFAFESRRLREDPQPGIDPESWSSFSGRSLAGTAPSALGMTSPIAGGAVLGLYGVNAYESAYDRYVERSIAQTGTFDPSTATGIGLATGAFEAAAEYLPIKFASKLGKRAVDLAIDAVVKGGSGAKLRAAEALATAMLGSSAVEGIEEGVTEVANTLLELMYDRDLQAEFESDPQSAMVDAVGRVASAFGQGALGGAMLGGFGIGRAAADAVSRTDAAGTGAAKPQGETLDQGKKGPGSSPPPESNYRTSIGDYADRAYRDTSVSGALDLLPGSVRSTEVGDVHLSHTENLALGQNGNTGVVIEFDPRDIQGQVNRSKPTWREMWNAGEAEYVARGNTQDKYRNSVVSFTIAADAKSSPVERAQMSNLLKSLSEKGWTKEKRPDGSVKWTRPDTLGQSGAPGIPGSPTPVMEWNVDNVAKALSVTPEQSHAIVALANAMGLDPSRLRAQRGGERNATVSPQGIKGQVEFTDAGDAIIRGVTSPDVSTGVHELSHVARRWLLDRNVPAAERAGITDTDIADAESWAGVGADGKWSVDAEEKLARGFEKYMRDGKAPVPRLQALFDRFRKWLLSIYQKLKGSPIDVRISPEMRRVFDSLVKRGSVAQAPLPDLYRAAVGEGYAETKPETPNRLARVARPDAIAALRAQGLWPTSTAPDDLTLELLTDPKFEPIVYLLSRKSDLSRTDATWLFGPENKEMGDKKTRAQWLEAFKGLAPPTAWNVPSFMTDLAPPTQPPAGGPQGAGGPDMVGLRKDFLTMRQRGWQDQFIQLFRLAQDVTPGQEFDAGSPVPVIRTVNSRIADETRRLNEERIAPLLERMKASGISGARVAEYLIARHVPEANEVAARRNPDNPAVASGMTDARAAAVVAKEERSKDFAEFDAIASEWRQILRDEFDASFDAGMMTEAEHAAMSQYWNYVPIMDDPEFLEAAGLASDESTLGPKKRLSVGRMQYVKRTGRTAESLDDPQSPRAKALFDGFLANVMTVAERRISRRLRNDFGNVLRRWVDDNPRAGDALTIVAEPPMVDMVVEGETQRVPDPNYRDQDNVLHFKAAEDFEAGGKKVRRGETFYIEVADPELGKILKSSSEVGDQGWKFLIGAMYMGTRATTLGATGPLALSFHVDNLIRDIAEVIGVAGAQKKAHGVRGHVYRQFRRNLVGAHMNLWGSRSNARMAGYREEWERLGGRMQMLGPVEFAKAKQRIDAALSDSTSAKVKNVAIALKNGIRVAVQPFELSTKLAYFASLRDNGVPAEKAAALTRDVMDYEKRGSATGPIRVAYAFTNPSIQGTERMISSLSGNPARMFQAAAFTAGIISALMSKWAIVEGWGDDEDEDGRPDWTQRLDYEKRMRFRIPFGAAGDALGIGNRVPDAIAVPVPYSQQLAHTLGAMLGEWTTGQRSTVNAAMAVAEAAADIYNPIGGSNIFEGPAAAAQALTPSIVRPMTDIAVNRNWFGGTIYNEPYPGQEVGWVDADNPRPSTAQSWVTLAQWMQRNVGIDLAPETIPYIIGSMFSTTGKDASQMFEIVSDSVDGDPTTDPLDRFPTKVPILRKFFVEGSNPAVLRQEYDSFRERAVRYENRLKDARARFDAVADDEEKRAAPLAEFRSTVNASDSAIAAEVRSAEAMIGKVRRHTRELRRALEDAVAQDDVETRRKIEAAIDRNRERMAIVMGHAVARMSGRSASASASGRTDRTSSREGSGRSTSATE